MDETHQPSWWRSPGGLALTSLAVIVAFYVLMEHTAHVLGALPYMFLLLCPLLHLFHHGHHHHRHQDSNAPTPSPKPDRP